MTSEILMMNDTCIALAADSAATVGHKIFSADKIFELTRNQPIAVMVYGSASISSVKVEILVKEFRRSIEDQRFSTVRACSECFLKFIEKGGTKRYLTNPLITKDHMTDYIISCYIQMWQRISIKFSNNIRDNLWKLLETKDTERFYTNVLDEMGPIIADLEEDTKIENAKEVARIEREIGKIITKELSFEVIRHELLPEELIKYHENMLHILSTMISNRCLTMNGYEDYTGIVVTGFGDKEYFPSFIEYKICGLFPGGLYYKELNEICIDLKHRSWISTFAQDEVVQTYLHGIDPNLREKILDDISELLNKSAISLIKNAGMDESIINEIEQANDQVVDDYADDLLKYTTREYLEVTERMISFLSKDEIADVAGSMISFMSLKRRVSEDDETVGGPVDVAVLSRGEGLIWIKRKYYFNRELNPFYRSG